MSAEFVKGPMERRREDRRLRDVPVPHERRQLDRRASPLSPARPFNGVAIVVDSWPLVRAGVRHLLSDGAMRVAADCTAVAEALTFVGDRLDLAVVGASREPILEAIQRIRSGVGPPDGGPPKVMVLVERVSADLLRDILATGVEGVLDRNVPLTDLAAAFERMLAGQRVLAGNPLAVLAASGLELTTRANGAALGAAEDNGGLLTRKEREVLAELGRNQSNREIAASLHLSAATVKTHLANIYGKLGVTSRQEALVVAIEKGLLQ